MVSNNNHQDTKFIYYIDEEETPYLVKLNISPDKVTLGDFKVALNRPHSKYFFKSLDDDFGVVKEEIINDNALLPCFNGRVISWLVTADESIVSESGVSIDNLSNSSKKGNSNEVFLNEQRLKDHKNGKLPTTSVPADSTSALVGNCVTNRLDQNGADTETESVHSANQDHIAPLRNFQYYKSGNNRHHHSSSNGTHSDQSGNYHQHHSHHNHHHHHRHGGSSTYEAPSSMMSSDLESTSFFDSEEESSRFSSVTGTTLSSRRYGRARQCRRRRRLPPISRASSFSSITDSTMSLNILAITLNMDTVNFLGISIVGQSNKAGDGGIYVGSIMKGGAVAQDGRIEPGDMILEVNGISFEQMSNDDAVRTLREQVQRPGLLIIWTTLGDNRWDMFLLNDYNDDDYPSWKLHKKPITLVVAKCWDPNPVAGYFTIPRQEPVRPIDPRAWVMHTNAMTSTPGQNGGNSGNDSNSTTTLNHNVDPGLTSGMSMGTLTSGQTSSMPLGTSAAAYNMAALLAASQQQQQQQQQQQLAMEQQQQQQMQFGQPFYPRSNLMIPVNYGQRMAPSIVTASSSLPELERYSEPLVLNLSTDISTVIGAMLQPGSGLDVRDRTWLKLTVPNAFIGSDLVDWLYRHIEGLADRKESRKYASNMLKLGYIRHIVNKMIFSEQCYYVFRDLTGHMSCLSLEEVDSVSEVGVLANAQMNWGHNTTSTSLTVGPPLGPGPGATQPPPPPARNDFNPMLAGHPVNADGRDATGSVPTSMYHQVPAAPNLAAPLRQLIAQGQNMTAAAASNHLGAPKMAKSRDDISGYSSSSTSTSSGNDEFRAADPSGHNKMRSSNFAAVPELMRQDLACAHQLRSGQPQQLLNNSNNTNQTMQSFDLRCQQPDVRQVQSHQRHHHFPAIDLVQSAKSSVTTGASSTSSSSQASGSHVHKDTSRAINGGRHHSVPPPPPPRIATASGGVVH